MTGVSAASLAPSYKLFYLQSAVIITIYMWERSWLLSLIHTLGISWRNLKVIYENKLIQRTAEEGLDDFILDRLQRASQNTRLLQVAHCTSLPVWLGDVEHRLPNVMHTQDMHQY